MHASARAMDLSAVWTSGGEEFVLEGDGAPLGLACVRGGEVRKPWNLETLNP